MSAADIFAIVFTAALLCVVNGWSYQGSEGPNNWSKTYPQCGGQRQSPIDLKDFTYTRSPDLTWSGYDSVPDSMTLTNNGHSVALTGEGTMPNITLDNGKIFQLANVHFHWGKSDSEGSEHTLKGQRFALEMHAVHTRVDDFGTAVTPQEAVVITELFAYWGRTGKFNNGLDNFIEYANDVVKADMEVSIEPFPWDDLITEFNFGFYWYEGSLTTPPCSESVTFFIKRQPSTISKDQLKQFRLLRNSDNRPMSGNFRPLQNRNGRKVYYRN